MDRLLNGGIREEVNDNGGGVPCDLHWRRRRGRPARPTAVMMAVVVGGGGGSFAEARAGRHGGEGRPLAGAQANGVTITAAAGGVVLTTRAMTAVAAASACGLDGQQDGGTPPTPQPRSRPGGIPVTAAVGHRAAPSAASATVSYSVSSDGTSPSPTAPPPPRASTASPTGRRSSSSSSARLSASASGSPSSST